MKLLSPKLVLWAILFAVALKAGPGCIHSLYRAVTPAAELDARTEEYEDLITAVRTLEPEQRAENLEHRQRLALWLRMRGVDVDGNVSSSIWQGWSELVDYWTQSTE